ncbi:hypothetical protein [Candidatus Finniella inopinata]|uniref:Tetratricopeptide repeat protein n=1 Tax=Candidatus Finniella inopinata TaxID=1696036 RepID=A0A4Q7DJ55_9PROT|nr:hypothetical protein [Candidatus Finniella inopinata]RZI46370.1 hypothetical protein EQU50_01920 [Candidatus Finniella inopinata]
MKHVFYTAGLILGFCSISPNMILASDQATTSLISEAEGHRNLGQTSSGGGNHRQAAQHYDNAAECYDKDYKTTKNNEVLGHAAAMFSWAASSYKQAGDDALARHRFGVAATLYSTKYVLENDPKDYGSWASCYKKEGSDYLNRFDPAILLQAANSFGDKWPTEAEQARDMAAEITAARAASQH